ncbi:MAG: hypothetical protein Q9224_006546 [Gallowayella concinna]
MEVQRSDLLPIQHNVDVHSAADPVPEQPIPPVTKPWDCPINAPNTDSMSSESQKPLNETTALMLSRIKRYQNYRHQQHRVHHLEPRSEIFPELPFSTRRRRARCAKTGRPDPAYAGFEASHNSTQLVHKPFRVPLADPLANLAPSKDNRLASRLSPSDYLFRMTYISSFATTEWVGKPRPSDTSETSTGQAPIKTLEETSNRLLSFRTGHPSQPGLGNLQEIPPEIRSQFWREIFQSRKSPDHTPNPFAIFRVSSQLHDEVIQDFYRNQSLTFDISPKKAASTEKQLPTSFYTKFNGVDAWREFKHTDLGRFRFIEVDIVMPKNTKQSAQDLSNLEFTVTQFANLVEAWQSRTRRQPGSAHCPQASKWS